jgi:hypothetical protein
MSDLSPPSCRKEFEIAVICAKQSEANAVEAVFDKFGGKTERLQSRKRREIRTPILSAVWDITTWF